MQAKIFNPLRFAPKAILLNWLVFSALSLFSQNQMLHNNPGNTMSDYVQIGNMGIFPDHGTVAFALNASVIENYRNPFATSCLSNCNNGIRFEEFNGNLGGLIGDDGGNFTGLPFFIPASMFQTNTWYRVALVWDKPNNSAKVYRDGNLVSTATVTTWPTQFHNVTIGAGYNTGRLFAGALDDVSLWTRALTDAEVAEIACNGIVNNGDPDLKGYWNFFGNFTNGAGQTVANQSLAFSGQFNGTTVGTATSPAFVPNVVYVDADATGNNTGSTWANAYTELADAIQNSCNAEIWVAEGTYKPKHDPTGNASPADPRTKTFFLKNGQQIYGGFNGTETERYQAVPAAYITTLSGDLGTAGDNSDNTYHVVWAKNVGSSCLLEGFTIRDGHANGASLPEVQRYGAGIMVGDFASPDVNTNPVFQDLKITENTAQQGGGGMEIMGLGFNGNTTSPYCFSLNFDNNVGGFGIALEIAAHGSPEFHSCTFQNNTNGAFFAVNIESQNTRAATPLFERCRFFNNLKFYMAAWGGGSVASPTVENCIFNNTSIESDAFDFGTVSPIFRNSTMYFTEINLKRTGTGISAPLFRNVLHRYLLIQSTANATAEHTYFSSAGSCPPGFTCGAGMLYASDPKFLDPDGADNLLGTADDDLRLTSCSPAVNAGTDPDSPVQDFSYNPRPFGGSAVDIGAYEFQGNASNPFNLSATRINPACFGTATGTATAIPQGSVNQYAYAWSDGQATRIATSLAAGVYTVTVTRNSNGCTASASATLTDPAQLNVTLSSTNPKCASSTDGRLTASATGGSGTKTYLWSTGATSLSALNLAAGTYTVTVTDAKGCTQTAEATLTEPPMLTLSHTVETLANGRFRVTLAASGGTPYPTGTPYKYCRVSTTGSCGFTSNDMYTIAAAGTYTFRARDKNGCIASIDVTLPPAFGPGGVEERSSGFVSDWSALNFAVSPNPFDNQLVVNTSSPLGGELRVKILDATGRLVMEKTWPVGTDRLTIEDTGDWPSGLFFVQITDAAGNAHANLKAVKAH